MLEASKNETHQHIRRVQELLMGMIQNLQQRLLVHDTSKLLPPESSGFAECTSMLKGLTYGSDEYKAELASMKDALSHHYQMNRHHPEHFKGTVWREEGKPDEWVGAGMHGMTLVDLVEMFCDWCAATERHKDGNIGKSIDHNMTRFGFGETLACIMVNTAQLYCMGARNHLAYRPTRNTELQEAIDHE